MGTILTILGIVVLALLAIILVLVLFFVLRIRRFMAKVPGALQAMHGFAAAFQPQPARLHLDRQKEAAWTSAPHAQAAIAGLGRLGYQPAGIWTTEQIPGATFAGFVHPATQVRALVGEMLGAGVWIDLVARFPGGGTLTVSNSPVAGTLIRRPGHDKVSEPGLDAEGLQLRLERELAGRALAPLDAAGYATEIERFYADEIEVLALREPTPEEVESIARRSGIATDPAGMARALDLERGKRKALLSAVVKERWRESDPVAQAGWEAMEDRVVAVHERLDAGEVRQLLQPIAATLPLIEPTDEGALAYFRTLNLALPAERRCRRLGAIAAPLAAELWLAPEDAEEEEG